MGQEAMPAWLPVRFRRRVDGTGGWQWQGPSRRKQQHRGPGTVVKEGSLRGSLPLLGELVGIWILIHSKGRCHQILVTGDIHFKPGPVVV